MSIRDLNFFTIFFTVFSQSAADFFVKYMQNTAFFIAFSFEFCYNAHCSRRSAPARDVVKGRSGYALRRLA